MIHQDVHDEKMHLFVLGYFKTNFILKQKCSKSEINNWKLDIRFLVLCQCDHEGCPLNFFFFFFFFLKGVW